MGTPKHFRKQLTVRKRWRGGKKALVIEFGFTEDCWEPIKIGNQSGLVSAVKKARDRFNERYVRGDTYFAVAVELPKDADGYNIRVLQLTCFGKTIQIDNRLNKEAFRYLSNGWGKWMHK